MAIVGARPPHCPRCGGAAVWHPQPGQWGCDSCQQMLPPIQHAPIATSPLAPISAPVYTGLATPDAPRCPRCGYPSVWHPALQHWGCDRCQLMNPKIQYLVLPSEATGQPAALTAAIKIGVSVILIVITIAIFVAIRF
jgi:ribosomal protein L37AE/L43A